MTQIKSIVIPNGNDMYDKLNDMTPDDMSFSSQVGLAVEHYVSEGDTIKEAVLPTYDAPIEDWIDYMRKNPQYLDDIKSRHAQLGNILRGDICHSINQC